MKNKKFKNFIDDSISPYPIFKNEEKENIMEQISNLNEKKILNKTFFPRVISTVVVSLICLFVIGLGIHQSGINDISTSEGNSTSKIDRTIHQNKKHFRCRVRLP
ncbi:hypothetical protein [Falsibacillus albus]|uniref:Uncharacterized protein n=1 Tax=Falsibacillus albus TaxID=2478915 RepID=A0A3L7JWR7_9BACI|nr:hypothetical protein [Falsibacillus albus]RLQ94569.1 hypothetical protein D9X91_13600 [Falsibacillus albus]